MKSRPRRIEREVAKRLSSFFSTINLPEVKRIPILGRAGPDIEFNDFGLIVDVKSRKSVPNGFLVNEDDVRFYHGADFGVETILHINAPTLVVCRLHQIDRLTLPYYLLSERKGSVAVSRWMHHMDEWTNKYRQDDISVLVLHKPGMNINNSSFIIKKSDLGVFNERYKRFSNT